MNAVLSHVLLSRLARQQKETPERASSAEPMEASCSSTPLTQRVKHRCEGRRNATVNFGREPRWRSEHRTPRSNKPCSHNPGLRWGPKQRTYQSVETKRREIYLLHSTQSRSSAGTGDNTRPQAKHATCIQGGVERIHSQYCSFDGSSPFKGAQRSRHLG